MATVKITYAAPVIADAQEVAPICPVFEPDNGYAKSDAYKGTVYEAAQGFGTWAGYQNYLDQISSHPGIFAMYRAAVRGVEADGTVKHEIEFEENDPMVLAYYNELAIELANEGFTTTVTEAAAPEAPKGN